MLLYNKKNGGITMYVNRLGENIIFESEDKNDFLFIHLAGVTNPNPEYFIRQNVDRYRLYNKYVLEYVIDGKGYIEFENEKIMVQKGDLYFLNKLNKHIYYSDKEEPFQKIFIVVSGKFVDALVDCYDIKESVLVVKNDCSLIFGEIHKLLSEEVIDYNQIAHQVLHLFQRLKEVNYDKSDTIKFSEEIKSFLDNHLEEKMSLEKISKALDISVSHILRIFRHQYGISPMKYFNQAKVNYACRLLVNTNYSIEYISELLNFNEPEYMAKCIKKQTGYSPIQYRKIKLMDKDK
jgi:AraC-like DNA-binding protein